MVNPVTSVDPTDQDTRESNAACTGALLCYGFALLIWFMDARARRAFWSVMLYCSLMFIGLGTTTLFAHGIVLYTYNKDDANYPQIRYYDQTWKYLDPAMQMLIICQVLLWSISGLSCRGWWRTALAPIVLAAAYPMLLPNRVAQYSIYSVMFVGILCALYYHDFMIVYAPPQQTWDGTQVVESVTGRKRTGALCYLACHFVIIGTLCICDDLPGWPLGGYGRGLIWAWRPILFSVWICFWLQSKVQFLPTWTECAQHLRYRCCCKQPVPIETAPVTVVLIEAQSPTTAAADVSSPV